VVVGEAAEFWCNVPARLAMHRPQPFQKPVNVVVVEDAGQRQLGGVDRGLSCSLCRAANAGDQAKVVVARRYAQGDNDIAVGVSGDQLG
jgi:hypothetical protein